MSNGDPLAIGITAPPFNRCDSGTLLYQQGSPFGTQSAAFWVKRDGAPTCAATIRGENFSSPPTPGVVPAGVLGMVAADAGGIGVLGTASANPGGLIFGETGVLGVTNSFGVVGRALTGAITTAPGVFISGTGVVGSCDDGVGVHGSATTGWGVIGDSGTGAGVTATSVSGVGIDARSQNSTAVQAVADGAGVGVSGRSSGGPGVEGFSANGVAGVLGRSERCGVWGESSVVGVYGTSPGNAVVGVATGSSRTSIGVVGSSVRSQGVLGSSTTGIGVVGRSQRGVAGLFEGDVVVQGAFYVTGLKAAAVVHPDGSQRAMFSLEAPESFFEDFGEVTLIGDSVVVALDADFAALVTRKKYQVFLTSYGPEALYVRRRDADGFEIARVDQEAGGKFRRIQVGYRIVARRADVKAARLPKVKMPAPPADMVTDVLPPARVARQTRRRVTAVPSTPKVPSPDLSALFDATPVEPGPQVGR